MGVHRFRYALFPHAGGPQSGGVIPAAAAFNQPLQVLDTSAAPQAHAFFQIDNEAVVIDTVKTSEEGNHLILRLYESHGAHQVATLSLAQRVRHAAKVNLLEEGNGKVAVGPGNKLKLNFKPFELVTLRI
jgi:alpha-mannosidase